MNKNKRIPTSLMTKYLPFYMRAKLLMVGDGNGFLRKCVPIFARSRKTDSER